MIRGRIASGTARLHTIDLPRPWGPEAPKNSVVVIRLQTDDGQTGTGFSWTPMTGATALLALLEDEIIPAVVGRDPHPRLNHDHLWESRREAGSGLNAFAIAGVDIALWDLEASSRDRSLAEHIGLRRASVPAYGSGVNLHYSLEELAAQAHRWVSAGFGAVKIKVGKADPREDVDRVAAVREIIGPQRRLMLDANQRWDLPAARRAMAQLERFDIDWIEEPLAADNLAGHADLRRSISTPVAVGENLHTPSRMLDYLRAGACDILQPNAIRIGGISPFLRTVDLAGLHGVRVVPHLLPDLSAQLALTLPGESWVEAVEDATLGDLGLLRSPSPVLIDDGVARVESRAGLGLDFI